MSAIGDKAALRAGVEAVSKESAGLIELAIVRPSDIPALMGDALAGDQDAGTLLRLVLDTRIKVEKASKRAPLLCVACPRALQRGYSLCAAIPAKDSPHQAIVLAVCPRCGPDRATIAEKAQAGFQKIWPDLRSITVTHPAGGQA